MYSRSVGTMPSAMRCLKFQLPEIVGSWESCQGSPDVRVFRNFSRKGGGIWVEFTYKNPKVVYLCPVKDLFGVRYFNLFGRIGIAYDSEHDILMLSPYGEYQRADD